MASSSTTVNGDNDDPLTQAMSMLNDDTNDFEDFAIDSDDDDDNNVNVEDVDLNDLDFDREFNLGSIDLNNNATTSTTALTNNDDNDIVGGKSTSASANHNLGKEGAPSSSVTGTGGGSDAEDGKQIQQQQASNKGVGNGTGGGGGGSVGMNSTVVAPAATSPSTNQQKQQQQQQHVHDHPLAHPLMATGTTPATTATATAATTTTSTTTSGSSSWTTSFASFASRAAASVQSAVENAEAVVLQNQQGGVGGTSGSANIAAAAGGAQRSVTTTSQVGAATAASRPTMSYQERQKLLHQQYHANNNNKGSNNANSRLFGGSVSAPQPTTTTTFVGGTATATAAAKSTLSASSSTPRASPPITNKATLSSVTTTASAATVRSPPSPQKTITASRTNATTNRATTPSTDTGPPSAAKTVPTFIDKLTSHLDTSSKKTKLISSALGGNLLPGERIIMFLNCLDDVKDSSWGHTLVGSSVGSRRRSGSSSSRGGIISPGGWSVGGAGGGLEDILSGSIISSSAGGKTTTGDDASDSSSVVTVWCCVMTFYRVAVFSYQASLADGKVLFLDDDDNENEGGSSGDNDSGGAKMSIDKTTSSSDNKKGMEIIQQWIHSQNVSIQFQSAHSPPPMSNGNNNTKSQQQQQRHHVFQIPLASIERVERTYSSAQRRAMASPGAQDINSPYNYAMSSTGGGAISSSTSIVSSSSSAAAVSAISSAMMVSLGSQMKPLLGSMTTNSSNSNLATGGGGGGGGTSTAIVAAGMGAGDSSSTLASTLSSGPMGIILHGKDGGRTIQFSTSNYTDVQRAQDALNTYAFPGRRNLGYLFAFESRRAEVMASNAGAAEQQGVGDVDGTQSSSESAGGGGGGGGNPIATAAKPTRRRFVPLSEYERQGIFNSRGTAPAGTAATSNGTATNSAATMSFASPWAPILNANANYGLCSTYPSVLVGPRSIVGDSDPSTSSSTYANGTNSTHSTVSSSNASSSYGDNANIGLLRRCAAFRSENRFPALTWGSSHHGGSIWRSSQPKVGLQGNRSSEDERYLYAIGEEAKRANLLADAREEGGVGSGVGGYRGKPPVEFLRMLCGRNNESDLILDVGSGMGGAGSGSGSACMLKIMDMRPKSAAMGNKTQGYGYENTNNYRGTTINFYGIGNIHAVRDAYQKVNALCLNPNTSDLQWMQLVENTNWPSMIRLILSASWQTAFHVHYNRLPVLVHCSHGWDRTSQVPALAQLLLDPHYRTREGFSTLVEKDFLSFGHPFHTRCGHGEGKNEQGGGDEGQLSPIFLQFLDCVFQIVNQFPDYFEFNTRYLLLLSEHIYSCRFGTLLCDSEREREVVAGIRQRTYCMWEYLDSIPELENPMFDKAASEKAGVLLMPLPMLLRNVTLWTDRYCMYGAKATTPCVPPSLHHSYPPMYTAQYLNEQPLVLHTVRNNMEGTLQRALDDVEMWKETALAALKDMKELKGKNQGLKEEEVIDEA